LSLRRTVSLVTVLLALLAIGSAISTVSLTNYLDHTVSILHTNLESVRLGQQIEIDLLDYFRISDRQTLDTLEFDLKGDLQRVKAYITSDDERESLADAEKTILSVFQRRHSTDAVPAQMGIDIEHVLNDLRTFVNINLMQARNAENGVAHAAQTASDIAKSSAAVLLLGVSAVLVWLGWFAFRPLLAIGDAMKAFATGKQNARAPEIGMQELRWIAHQFNQMSEALARQRENQLAFLAGVAHDLRNPVNALKMSTGILDSDDLPPQSRIRDIVRIVRRQIDHLNRMIEDLLDAYSIESGNLELRIREVDAREIVHDAFELFRYVSAAHQVTMHVPETAVPMHCDPGRMGQVLNNLLGNAIKYSPNGGVIDIRLCQAAEQALITISDSGVGIRREDISHIFEPFRRARRDLKRVPGLGLGLHVVQRIVEAHGGRIEVESRPGSGTTFKVSIPK
jgi:two-component system, OmpR family, sensor histidine kinase MtrB